MTLHEALARFPGFQLAACFSVPDGPKEQAQRLRTLARTCEYKGRGLPMGSDWSLDAVAYDVIADHLDPPRGTFVA